jgi:hypothetical protein
MKDRCNNSQDARYKDYGGRGVVVCNEWLNNYEAFRDWATANGYNDNLTIDRINNDGNYEPGNCRWATTIVQQRNKRAYSNTGHKGIHLRKDTGKYTAYITLDGKTFMLGNFSSLTEALDVRQQNEARLFCNKGA